MSPNHVQKPHIVCVPYPVQGHINPFMYLAKLLHCKGFHITFVNTEFNHKRLLRSQGPDFVKGLQDFRFEAIPDGLPVSDSDATQDIPALCESIRKHCCEPFKEVVKKVDFEPEVPKVSLIIADAITSFAVRVAEDLGIPAVQLCTSSACGFMGYFAMEELVQRGIVPFKDENFISDGTLDTTLEWIPGMKGIKLKDLPSFIRVTNKDDIMLNFLKSETQECMKSTAIIFNTFQELETEVLEAIGDRNPNIYTIGPLHLLGRHFHQNKDHFKSSGSSLWKNDSKCVKWLDNWAPNSVIYVNYGSITVMTEEHFKEFAWGLANSKHPFLWIVRPDVVMGESAKFPEGFLEGIKDRGYITSWCPQEQVLKHPSVGLFLTHCGWNSTLESISEGIPVICWSFFSDQLTNCRYLCKYWGIGMELKHDVKREDVEGIVREVMEGDKGKEMRKKALEWKENAMKATDVGGLSSDDFNRFIKEVLHFDG